MTNIKLDDTWRGTNESFLMHYNDQLRLLDSLVDSGEKRPDNARVTFLESAIESVPDLRCVKITDNVLQAQLGSTRPISYRSYFDLLKDAAFHLDQATKRGNKTRCTNVRFSGPNDEDAHHNLSSDDNQVIQPENVCSEPPESLSYSLFQSHFQGSSTPNTQKIFLPKPIWEKLSKDQQQMIIDHNRSLPKSGSTHLSTPNKSPSPLPHKPTPQQTAKSQQVHIHQSDESTTDTTPSDPLLAMVHQSIHTSDDDASDISKVLSVKMSRQIQVCQRYIFQHANHTSQQLVDRGANGGLAGSDMRVIHKTHRKINIQGIDNHEVTGLDVVTAATLLNTSQGKVIGIFNEYAYLGKGSSIHSSGQLEWFKTNVDEKSVKVGGTQLITTLDGYSVPLLIKDGLAYATSLGKPTDQDMDTYPHVFFTSPDEWDPSVLDHDPPQLDGLDPSQVPDQPFGDPMFDAYGDFNERIIANLNILLDAPPEDCGSYTDISSVFTANFHQSSPQEPDWNALRPIFAWTSPSSIKDTFNVTTRHGTAPHTQDYIKKHFKSRNPVFNIPRCSEAVATDTIISDTPAVDDGSTMAQFFCGRDTLVCDAYGIKSTKQFINTLSDNIRKRGAMDTLISDGGKYEISKRVTDLLCSLFIQDYQSEPYHQHQNKAENHFGLAKRYTNTPLVALPAVGSSVCSTSVLYSTTWHLLLFKAYALFKPCKELLQMLASCSISQFMSLSTTGLILLNLISTFLHHLMKRKVIGSVLPTTKVTVSPGGSSLRILKRSSFVLAFEVLSELQQTSIMHHLQGRGPHFLFLFPILNNLKILCHLTPLIHQHPILSNLSQVSLVKMKIIQSTWPTLTFPIFLADPSFYPLRIMGSTTWPRSLTLMTMDSLLKTLNSD